MLLYQKNDLLNFVKGNLPESPAPLSVGFIEDNAVIMYEGVQIQLTSDGGTVSPSDSITLNGVEMNVPNPELVVKLKDGEYHLTGKIATASDEVTSAWGYEKGTHLYVIKVEFDGDIDPETFSGTIDGKVPNKPITYSKFDGPNYIYYILDSSTKTITIKYKANENAEEKVIKIYNDAIDA